MIRTPQQRGPSVSEGCSRPLSVADVFLAHASDVWRALAYLGVRESDLADASQEVFVVVVRKLPEFRGESRIDTWLYGICLRVAHGMRRGKRSKMEEPAAELPDVPVGASQEQAVQDREAFLLLQEALDELSDDQREVFVLSEIEQLPMKLVAEAVGCPLFTAYSRLRLARERIERFVRAKTEGAS